MKKKILIDANFPTETRVAVIDKNGNIESFEYDSEFKRQIKGNIYLAKITRVEPSLQAAFVDFGEEKSGFLPFSEIHPSYYNIPVNDKQSHLENLAQIDTDLIDERNLDKEPSGHGMDSIVDIEEINIDDIEKLIDERIQPEYDISASDDDIERISNNTHTEELNYKIQEVIKKGQVLLVQATKEERGNKGASLTTYISLAGKYCVLIPNKGGQNGISRKISRPEERRRLKSIINKLCPENSDLSGSSMIVRTAGAGHSSLDIKRDFDYLARLWNKIRKITLESKAPCFIHQEDGLLLKTVRDLFDNNVKELIIQGSKAYEHCTKFVKEIMPAESSLVKQYQSKTPIFTKFNIEEQLIRLYQTNVQMPSGGYIVINPTEALISIDVNSGKSTQERSVEEMALKTNLEAAREISRQARLRDLSGLIVIDFIDMSEQKNRRIVERSLKEFLSRDKARIQTSTISSFGLLEMSRQRLKPSFLESNSTMCSHCSGKGVVRGDEANSMLILRTIENEIYAGKYSEINVYGIASSIIYILNNKRTEINFIEEKYNVSLNFYIDAHATSDSYSIETVKINDRNKQVSVKKPMLQDVFSIYGETVKTPDTGKSRRQTNKKKDHKNQSAIPSSEATSQSPKDAISGALESLASHSNESEDNKLKNNELKAAKRFNKSSNTRRHKNQQSTSQAQQTQENELADVTADTPAKVSEENIAEIDLNSQNVINSSDSAISSETKHKRNRRSRSNSKQRTKQASNSAQQTSQDAAGGSKIGDVSKDTIAQERSTTREENAQGNTAPDLKPKIENNGRNNSVNSDKSAEPLKQPTESATTNAPDAAAGRTNRKKVVKRASKARAREDKPETKAL